MHKIILSGNCNLNLSRKVENLNPFSRKYLKGFSFFYISFMGKQSYKIRFTNQFQSLTFEVFSKSLNLNIQKMCHFALEFSTPTNTHKMI